MIKRPQFNLMKSFWDAGKTLPDEMRLKYYDALLQYGFTQTLPEDICAVANALLVSNKPILDISWTRYLAKAGKTKQEQTEIKSKSNQNQNQIKQDQIEKNEGKEEGERKKEKGERKMEVDTTPLNPLKGKQYTDGFITFWTLCNNKKGKGTASNALAKIRKTNATELSDEDLANKYNSYCANVVEKRGDIDFAKHPASWLNAGSYDDEEYVPSPATPTPSEPQYFEPANRSDILKVYPNRHELVDTPWSELTPDVQQVITEKCKEL